MKKPDVQGSKGGSLDNDLDVFDEFESGESFEGAEAPPEPEAKGDFDISGMEEAAGDQTDKEELFASLDVEPMPADEPSHDEGRQKKKTSSQGLADELLQLSPDVPVNLVAVIGKSTSNVGDVMRYRIGSVVDLGRPPNETVDLVANGKLIARGELVDMDGKLGVKIVKLVR